MRAKQPETIVIDGMLCESPKLAMERLGMKKSSFNELVAASRSGLADVPLRFIQYQRNSPRWFPIEWTHEFVVELGKSTKPAIGDKVCKMIRNSFK